MSVLNGNTLLFDTDYGVDHSKVADNLTVMGSLFPNGFEGAFFGRLTDFNIWSQVLTEEQAQKWTSCAMEAKGDLLDWSTATWRSQGLHKERVEKSEVCSVHQVQELIVFLMPQFILLAFLVAK